MEKNKDKISEISVIVPIYNAAKYLNRCIKSILAQSFKNFELILIDDGSFDDSRMVCNKFAKKDNRIRVFHKKINEGVSSARNIGLTNAIGNYICFVDSDDWVEVDYLINLYKSICNENILIIQNYFYYKRSPSLKRWNLENISFNKKNFNKLFTHLDILRNGSICSKLYSAHVIRFNSIRFTDNIHYAEDCLFMLEYLKYIDVVKYVNYAGYHHMHNHNSLSSKYHLFETELNAFLVFKSTLENITKIFYTDDIMHDYINSWLGQYFLRSILSFYLRGDKLTFRNRINFHKQAYYYGIKSVSNLNRFNISLPLLFSIYLYRYRLFYFYDFYMQFYMEMRKLKMNA